MGGQKALPNKFSMNRNDESFDEITSRAKPPTYKPGAKIEPKSVKAADRNESRPSPNANIIKKKTKNVFRDESDESSSSSEEENAPYFKSAKKPQPAQSFQNKAHKNETLDLLEPV